MTTGLIIFWLVDIVGLLTFTYLLLKEFNMNILESASKIVFIMIALTACVGVFVGTVTSDNFMVLAGMCFAFYFANKGEPAQPYAGK